jgi:hypothetical protein
MLNRIALAAICGGGSITGDDGTILPVKKGQPPPDLTYFRKAGN